MIYTYRCPGCQKITEVEHSMSECDNPTEKTQLATSCNENTCTEVEHSCLGAAWERVITAPHIKITGAWRDPHRREKFKQHAQQRSLEDFRETTWDKLDAVEKEHHKRENPDSKLFK